jgi:hypothetical protein
VEDVSRSAEREMGETKRYPLPGMVTTYRVPASPSRSALRMIAICVLRLPSSTATLGHTQLINSSFVTTSPARSTSVTRRSRARAPIGIGLSSSSRSCCDGRNRNEPKEISPSTGVVAFEGVLDDKTGLRCCGV